MMNEDDGQIVFLGNDGWEKISTYLADNHIETILLVTGRHAYSTSEAEKKLAPALAGKDVIRVFDFETNPKVHDIQRILNQLPTERSFDAIIAVGGGSVMDVSKLIKAYWSSTIPVADCIQNNTPITPAPIPLMAVPSTAGSGSEATHFAVVYHNQQKFSIAHDDLRPDIVYLIPTLLESLPTHVAAASGMDALCQAIESYWSIYSTDQSRAMAKEAIRLAWRSLKEAVLEKSPQALENMSRAAYLAGQAINLTRTTAPHAVSYALTTFYGIPHGHAVGLLVPYFFTYNASVSEADCLDARGPAWVKATIQELTGLLASSSVNDAGNALLELMKAIKLETHIRKLGVKTADDIEVVIAHGFNPQRVNNNPRRLTNDALRDILTEMISV